MSDPANSQQTAESDHSSFRETPVGAVEQPCPVSRVTKEYWIEARVLTRLGNHAVRGAKLKVCQEDWGATQAKGTVEAGGVPKRKKYANSSFEVACVYENTEEKLKKEEIHFKASDADPDQRSIEGEVRQKIAKVEDVAGSLRDQNFERKYSLAKHPDEAEWLSPDATSEGLPILRVTIRVATFSIKVGYMNQNLRSDSVSTRPGGSKDPESSSHTVSKTLVAGSKWPGNVLCSPTSATMVAEYWMKIRGDTGSSDRKDILQAYYDQWANEGFPERFDKTARVDVVSDRRTVAQSVAENVLQPLPEGPYYPPSAKMVLQPEPPPAPADGSYWLCSAQEPFQLWRCAYTYSCVESATDDTLATASQYSTNSTEHDPHHSIEYQWIRVPEGWWRTVIQPTSSGSNVWQYHHRTAKVLTSFAPDGAKAATGISASVNSDKWLALSKPLPGEVETDTITTTTKGKSKTTTTKIELEKSPLNDYKDWLAHGWPFIVGTNATGSGHVMVVRGAVVDEEGDIHWLICNDPYGNLASEGTVSMVYDIQGPVGRDLDNAPADVSAVQNALKLAGYWPEVITDACSGDEDDPLVVALRNYQSTVLKVKKPDGLVIPKSATEKKLGVAVRGNVGLSGPSRRAENQTDDVIKTQQLLEALGHYSSVEQPGICTDNLVAAIEAFQRSSMPKDKPSGFIGNGSKTEIALAKAASGQSYSGAKKEKEINEEGTNNGNGARGRHVYYRNSTPGHDHKLRIGKLSCARVEYTLDPEIIASNLVPGK